jgi:hypothetical protein
VSDSWPVALAGVTETVVATRGPNGRWNLAALGVHAGDPPTAVTWGNTRTRRNFEREGGGVVQFTVDPRDFVDAALSVFESEEPVLDSADAWVRVDAERVGTEERGGTRTETWELAATDSAIRRERVRTINRGFGAVVDATVAASRLDVSTYETATLLDRLAYFERVVERCGGPAERAAFARIDEHVGWRDRNESL